jgi:hypothetical protein
MSYEREMQIEAMLGRRGEPSPLSLRNNVAAVFPQTLEDAVEDLYAHARYLARGEADATRRNDASASEYYGPALADLHTEIRRKLAAWGAVDK